MEEREKEMNRDGAEDQGETREADDRQDTVAADQQEPDTATVDEAALLRDKAEAMRVALMKTKARLAAQKVGIKPERVDLLIRLTNLDDIDVTHADADHRIEMALRSALGDIPEWAIHQDTGSRGGHRRTSGSAPSESDRFREDFRRGMKR